MLEEQKIRIEDSMTKMLDEVDKTHLRALQAKMFKCMAKCCEDKDSSMVIVQRCIQSCGLPFQTATKIFQQELDHMEGRYQRCVMTCNDSLRDKVGSGSNDPNDPEVSRCIREFEDCAKRCVDDHVNLIPNTLKKLKRDLK